MCSPDHVTARFTMWRVCATYWTRHPAFTDDNDYHSIYVAQSCHNQKSLQLIMIIIQIVSCETIKDGHFIYILLNINLINKRLGLSWFHLLRMVFNKRNC